MSRRTRLEPSTDDEASGARSELVKELERLSQETTTDKMLDSLERELHEWAPKEEAEEDSREVIDRLNRRLISRSVFREGLDEGFHEDSHEVRPMESEVRKGLEELRKLIELGKPPAKR